MHHALLILLALAPKPPNLKPDQNSKPNKPSTIPTFPCNDQLDKRILALSVPAVVNFLIQPLTASVDLFWISKLQQPLANAGAAAANQVFTTGFWFTSFIPTLTTPRVAKAAAAKDTDAVVTAVGEGLFLAVVCGGTILLAMAILQNSALSSIGSLASLPFSQPYLRWRLPGVLFEAIGNVGFSAFRGVQDTVTPLQISLASNIINIIFDPLFMFAARMGVAGAALATTVSQFAAAGGFIALLLRRGILRLQAFRPPTRSALASLAGGGLAVQLRAIALNAAFIGVTRTTQRLDSVGTGAAAHSVALQIWQLGGVMLFALSTVASIIIPAESVRGEEVRRAAAIRFLWIGGLAGAAIGVGQLAILPALKFFSPSPAVARAALLPSIIGALIQPLNGLTFVGEGVMIGSSAFGALAMGQVIATVALLLFLRGCTELWNVWLGFALFNALRLASVARFYFKEMRLRRVHVK